MNKLTLILIALGLSCSYAVQPADLTACLNATPLVSEDEAGETLYFGATLLDYQGKPISKAAIIAYQADAEGLYNPPDAGTRIPRLRAVAISNDEGEFCFKTIRPATYPDNSEPAHIHLEINAAAHRLKYVTYWFEDDSLIDDAQRQRAKRDNEIVIVLLDQRENGWQFFDEIQLEGN